MDAVLARERLLTGITYERRRVRLDVGASRRLARLTGLPEEAGSHPCLPFSALYPMIDQLLADTGFARDAMLHAAARLRFGLPVTPRDELTVRTRITRVGTYGDRLGVELATTVTSAAGRHLATTNICAFDEPVPAGVPLALRRPAPRRLPRRSRRVEARLTAGFIDAYAELSGDRNPIHLSDEAARAAGLPGRIAHGMALLSLGVSTAQVLEGRRVEEISIQFSRPVSVGSTVEFGLHRSIDPSTSLLTASVDRRPVLRPATVRFAPLPSTGSLPSRTPEGAFHGQ